MTWLTSALEIVASGGLDPVIADAPRGPTAANPLRRHTAMTQTDPVDCVQKMMRSSDNARAGIVRSATWNRRRSVTLGPS
jgi:hypothetical protein